MTGTVAPLLEVSGLVSGYGPTVIVDQVSFALPPGEALAVLGRNGAGKTTLINTIAGRLPARAGAIGFRGVNIVGWPAEARCRAGLAFVPQDRQVFATLTVEENLAVADCHGAWTLSRVYALFPRLAERRGNGGGQLSGGEQQMLAIGRALMASPVCLLLDEPFEGLAPVVVDSLMAALAKVRAEDGVSIVLVEQHAGLAVEMSDAGLVVERGQVRTSGSRSELLARWSEIEDMLAVTAAMEEDT